MNSGDPRRRQNSGLHKGLNDCIGNGNSTLAQLISFVSLSKPRFGSANPILFPLLIGYKKWRRCIKTCRDKNDVSKIRQQILILPLHSKYSSHSR